MYIGSILTKKIFVIIAILYVFLNLEVIIYMFSKQGGNWDIGVAFFSIPMLILISGTYLFYKNIKLGWYLLALFSIYALLNQLVFFLLNIGLIEYGKIDLFMLLPDVPTIFSSIVTLVFILLVIVLNNEEIRTDYSVKKMESIGVFALAVSIFITLLII